MNSTTPTPEALARSMSRAEIRERMERIRWNLDNPVPACRASRASLNAARRDASRALTLLRAALRLAR